MENTEAAGMLCPHCRCDLVMSERQGIEIDYCPKCRGIWLDRGELDRIIEKAVADARATSPSPPPSFLPRGDAASGLMDPRGTREPSPYEHSHGYREDDDDHHRDGPRRRESFLQRLFD